MKISWCITVHDEITELKRLFKTLSIWKNPQDEIVIQQDDTHFGTNHKNIKQIEQVFDFCEQQELSNNITFRTATLNKDFSAFKNNLFDYANGEYIVQIDADEVPHIQLIENLGSILDMNPSVDLYRVPRINTVKDITEDYIKKMRWDINKFGWINSPDYQSRIYKNVDYIKWKNKVHEVITGFKEFSNLPIEEEYSFYHPKTIEKQIKQNEFYETI